MKKKKKKKKKNNNSNNNNNDNDNDKIGSDITSVLDLVTPLLFQFHRHNVPNI